MRLRLGLLQDPAAIEKQIAREASEAAAKAKKATTPTAKTEAETKAEELKEKARNAEKKPSASKPKIRPLSEAKAIDSGATFISETFLFSVGLGLIIFESWRSRRKENNRREDVAGRINELEDSEKAARRALVELEKEVLRLRAAQGEKMDKAKRILPKEVWAQEEAEEEESLIKEKKGWLSWVNAPWGRAQPTKPESGPEPNPWREPTQPARRERPE